MGQSTDGQLWHGVVFGEEQEFPWDADPFDGDIEVWWRSEQGFRDPENVAFAVMYAARKEFDKSHPCPAEAINYCSGEYPMWGLAVRGTAQTASRGYPKRIEGLGISREEVRPLKDLCEKYGLTPVGEPGWYLSSYWG